MYIIPSRVAPLKIQRAEKGKGTKGSGAIWHENAMRINKMTATMKRDDGDSCRFAAFVADELSPALPRFGGHTTHTLKAIFQ